MTGKIGQVLLLATVCALMALCGLRADNPKLADDVKAEDFKGKTFDLKEKGKVSVTLTFTAGKEAEVTVRSEKKSDVNLYVYDSAKKVVKKDDSPGPDCDLKFTPKEGGKYTLEVVNLGPGDNRSTLKVSFAKSKDK